MTGASERFAALFRGLTRAYGKTQVTGKTKDSGKAEAKCFIAKEAVTLQLYVDHLEGRDGLGIVPIQDDNTVWWGALDVDDYQTDHAALERRVAGTPLVLARSKSGGAHLFLFCAEPVPASLMRRRLNDIRSGLGLGKHEVFPKQDEIKPDDFGNFLNLPYYDHVRTTRYGIRDGQALSLEEFLDHAESRRLTHEELETFKLSVQEVADALPDGPPCLNALCAQGVSAHRNNTLLNVGIYLKRAFPDDWEQRVLEYNFRYLKPPLDAKEIESTILKSLRKKDYGYKCTEEPLVSFCHRQVCLKRKFGVRGTGSDGRSELPEITGLVKLAMEPPLYFVSVDGHRVGPVDSETLHVQAKFQRACMDQSNCVLADLPKPTWTNVLAKLFEEVHVVQLPGDAQYLGRVLRFLWSFADEFTADSPEAAFDAEKCYRDFEGGFMYFTTSAFEEYYDRRLRGRDGPSRAHMMATLSRDLGAEEVIVGERRCSLWRVPLAHFSEYQRTRPPAADLAGSADDPSF